MMHAKEIIVFDGICNLCNFSVQFIIKRDKNKRFKFVSAQSDIGTAILEKYNFSVENLRTLLLIKEGNVFIKSSAILEIIKTFGGIWSLCSIFSILPEWIRDFMYDLVAKNRYRFFGKRDSCMMPSEDIRSRFL